MCVVYNHVKDTKFHQFTTLLTLMSFDVVLSIITSKIQNFINSQRLSVNPANYSGCL